MLSSLLPSVRGRQLSGHIGHLDPPLRAPRSGSDLREHFLHESNKLLSDFIAGEPARFKPTHALLLMLGNRACTDNDLALTRNRSEVDRTSGHRHVIAARWWSRLNLQLDVIGLLR